MAKLFGVLGFYEGSLGVVRACPPTPELHLQEAEYDCGQEARKCKGRAARDSAKASAVDLPWLGRTC